MSYKALYRTYRPSSFNEVVGQDHIISTLKNIISMDKVSHAYLFAGPRGTGKTSVAHLFSKILNCSSTEDATKTCGKCQQCQTINSMDIVEIDAASNNGVGDVRALIDKAQFAPSISKYKVYIIDEVHMFSKGAFNALLKIIEEPPKYVVFILATTEADKIPVTILSRTQRFNFRRIANDVIEKKLVNILNKESISYDEESIKMIAKLSNGGMRDALSIADQVSAFSNGSISFEAISQVFGVVSILNQIKLMNLAFDKKTKELLKLGTNFIDDGGDIERITISLIDILKDFIVYNKTSDIGLLNILTKDELEVFIIDTNFAYDAIDILMNLLSGLKLSESPRQSFELMLLKITEIKKDDEVGVGKQKIIMTRKSANESVNKSIDNKQEEIESHPEQIDEFEEKLDTNEKEDEVKESEIKTVDNYANIESDFLNITKKEKVITPPPSLTKENISSQIKNTDMETDLSDSFKFVSKDSFSKVEGKASYSTSEIINLLLQANKEKITGTKKLWDSILSFTSEPKYGTYANLLMKTAIISVGKDFVLISSEQSLIISQINMARKQEDFINLISELLGEPKLVFAITKDEFQKVKEKWRELSKSGELPEPYAIEKLSVKAKKVSEAEAKGARIFGKLLKR